MGFFEEVLIYVDQGGYVMWPLLLGAVLMWYGLGWRMLTLRRGARANLRDLMATYRADVHRPARGIVDAAVVRGLRVFREGEENLRRRLDEAFADYQAEIDRYSVVVRSIVIAAPLTGLLGTVSGMIETFDSLADMSLYSQSGGIAGGISQALFTTQLGLAVAVPGLLVGRMLTRRQTALELELMRLKDLLCAEARTIPVSARAEERVP